DLACHGGLLSLDCDPPIGKMPKFLIELHYVGQSIDFQYKRKNSPRCCSFNVLPSLAGAAAAATSPAKRGTCTATLCRLNGTLGPSRNITEIVRRCAAHEARLVASFAEYLDDGIP